MAISSSGAVSIGSAAGSGRSINVELGRTQNTANSTMTAVVTAAITGTTPRGSGTVTEAQPHAFSEWHSYVHTVNFPSATYHSRTGTTVGSWAARCLTWHEASEAHSAGGIYIFQREISGDTVFQAEVVTGPEAGTQASTANEKYRFNAGSQTTTSFGSYSNHNSPISIITIPGVTGISASLSASPVSGYSHTAYPIATEDMHSSMASLSGFVGNSWQGESDGPLGGYGALFAFRANGTLYTTLSYTQWIITISKTGYNNLTLTTFITKSRNRADSTGGL